MAIYTICHSDEREITLEANSPEEARAEAFKVPFDEWQKSLFDNGTYIYRHDPDGLVTILDEEDT